MAKARRLMQLLAAAAQNSFVTGFAAGKIYQGNLKSVCVPGLNCSSCPGALMACPIGALQAVLGANAFTVSCYVTGLLLVFGATLGRFICGFLCPFGFIQELLHKIPFRKKLHAFRGDKPLRSLKYATLLLLVILMPMLLPDETGNAPPYFCKLVCPAGTLEAGIPLVLYDALAASQPPAPQEGMLLLLPVAQSGLHEQVGALFGWKVALLFVTVLLSVIIWRPFCKYLCPLGAIYAMLNPVSLYRLRLDANACVQCGACKKACGMGIAMPDALNSRECVRCGDCVRACPKNALKLGFREGKKS